MKGLKKINQEIFLGIAGVLIIACIAVAFFFGVRFMITILGTALQPRSGGDEKVLFDLNTAGALFGDIAPSSLTTTTPVR